MVINMSDNPVSIPLAISGAAATGTAQVWLFDKDHKAEQQADLPLSSSTTISPSAQSMTLLVIK
jgi:hypothetical protein